MSCPSVSDSSRSFSRPWTQGAKGWRSAWCSPPGTQWKRVSRWAMVCGDAPESFSARAHFRAKSVTRALISMLEGMVCCCRSVHQFHAAHHHRLPAQDDAIAAHAELDRAATCTRLEGVEVILSQ